MPRESASRSTTALSPRSGSTPSASSHGESQRDSWKPVSRNTPTASSSSGSVVPPTMTSISSGPYRPNEDHPPPQTAGSPAGSDACVAGPGAPPHPSSDGVVVAPPAPSHRPPRTPAFGPSTWSPSDRYSPLESEGVDVRVVLGIREIVSGSLHVIGRRVVAGQRDLHLLEAVRIRFETQRQQQLAQRPSGAGDKADGNVVPPGLAQPGHCPAPRAGAQHPGACQSSQLGADQVSRPVEVCGHSAVHVETATARDRRPQLLGLGGIRDARRLAALHARPLPPANVLPPLEAGRLEQRDRLDGAGREAHLFEPLLARLGDRRGQHRPRDALSAVRGGNAQALVPDQARGIGSQALHAGDHAVDLGGLELGARIRHPLVEHLGDVVAAAPHILRELEDPLAICRPHGPYNEVRGCQCAIPARAMPPSKTSSSPSRTSISSSSARTGASSQASPSSIRLSRSASSMSV